jgi:shikimate dehydrogenase
LKKYGLIGYPLKNSFSQNYFTHKFAQSHISASYQNYPLTYIDEFKELLAQHHFNGLNVTIPYKEAIIPFLTRLDVKAQEVGAVNTIAFKNNERIGYNTDVYGFEKSILPLLKPWHQMALVLGSGGAAKAVMYVLKKLGIKTTLVSRNPEMGIGYEDLDKAMIRAHQVIVNCTPLGMYPNEDDCPPIPYQYITDLHLAYDLIYLPEETLFLKYCKQHQAITKNGFEMLQFQAEKAWEIWNNNE